MPYPNQMDFGFQRIKPLNLRNFTRFALGGEGVRRKIVEQALKPKPLPSEKKPFDPAGSHGPALRALQKYVEGESDPDILEEEINKIKSNLKFKTTHQARQKCVDNSESLEKYVEIFGDRHFKPYKKRILRLPSSKSHVEVRPDLWVIEDSQIKLIKLRFTKSPPDHSQKQYIDFACAAIYQAQIFSGLMLPHSSVFYMDVYSGDIFESKKLAKCSLKEIQAILKRYEQMYLEYAQALRTSENDYNLLPTNI